MRFVCIDFETANSHRTSACQLGAVSIENGAIADQRCWLIRPQPAHFDAMCVSIHGITPDAVRDSPTFADIWPDVWSFIEGACLVAHSASFDMSVLGNTLAMYELRIPHVQYLCTVQLSATLWQRPDYKLPSLCSFLGIALDHHNALSDATACAHLLLQAFKDIGVDDPQTALSRLPISPRTLKTDWAYAPRQASREERSQQPISDLLKERLPMPGGDSVFRLWDECRG